MESSETNNMLSIVKEYYGETLSSSSDLQTTACCTAEAMPKYIREILPLVSDEVQNRFYGCGSPIPPALEGCTVLDLGCGTGRDCFLISKLVGPKGHVLGVDMTDEQIAVAVNSTQEIMSNFGYAEANVTFKKGFIEDLKSLEVADSSVDVVVSNCVINLSPNKEEVFKEIFRVLKPGGQLYFSDVFSSRRVPKELLGDPVLRGECLSGALYYEDFRRMLEKLDCPDVRLISSGPVDLTSDAVKEKIGMIEFTSSTVSAFKLNSLEDVCEDYGQVATYLGTIKECPHEFMLDDHHTFITGKPMLVCGNTAAMIEETRFSKHFEVRGDRSTHFGLFDCGEGLVVDKNSGSCC